MVVKYGDVHIPIQLMPNSLLACDEYGALKLPVAPLSFGLREEAGGGRTISVRIHGGRWLDDFI